MIRVKATREGIIGGKTSTGYIIDTIVPFVALPAFAALRQWIYVRNPVNGIIMLALILDVGPWNVNDNAYIFQPATVYSSGIAWKKNPDDKGIRPQSESGLDVSHNGKTNGAGIDLSEKVWNELKMTDNFEVEWEFAQ